jgi:DNA-directed RNA polymerase specialized sigma subunit
MNNSSVCTVSMKKNVNNSAGTHLAQSRSASSSELLDDTITSYYLRYLPECRRNVVKGMAILDRLQESQNEIFEALSLKSRGLERSSSQTCSNPDHGYFYLQDEFESEKKAILKESILLQNHLKNENHKIVILEGCIFSLPEPQRSVIVSRYVDRMSWPAIQQKLNRSASRIFSLHKDGINGILAAVRDLSYLSGCQ